MKRSLILYVLISLIFTPVIGQVAVKKQYTATRITTAPVINGNLEDKAWLAGTWSDDFTQNQPFTGRRATQRTEFNILFDDDNLYVAIKAYDTAPDSIVNRLTRRDEADGDMVAIILDSYHDLRTGFLFGVSSAGVKYDLMMTNDDQNEDPTWDPNWWVRTSVNKEGWIAEMKIPFSQVRFEKNSGEVWGLQIARVIYRKNETDLWQHIAKDAPGFIHLFGELKGLEQIKPRKILDVTPYAVAKAETFQKEPENPFMAKGRKSGLNGGVDAKIGVTNNMTMDLTVNPDFGQVEADPSEVNLSAYETFYKEKRPFFIEGNNITNFGLGIGDGGVGNDNLFYSRRIGRRPQLSPDLKDGWNDEVPIQARILGAAKLTGKTKKGLSLGFVEAVTQEEKAHIDTIGGRMSEVVEPLTNYLVGRVQKDMNNGNTLLGGIMTAVNRKLDGLSGNTLHKSAYSAGADFTQYFKNKNWMFNLNTAFSLVQGSKEAILKTQETSAHYFQRPDKNYALIDSNKTSLAGSGGRLQIMKMNGHWYFMGATIWRTPGFETNDMGYTRQADQVVSVLWAQYNEWEPKWIYKRFSMNADIFSFLNFGGNLVTKGFEWNGNMDFKNFWFLWTGGAINGNSLDPAILRGGPLMKTPGSVNVRLGFNTDSRKKIVFNLSLFESKGNKNSSDDLSINPGISYKPTNYLSFSVNPGFSKSFSQLQYITSVDVANQQKYIFSSISRRTVSTSFRVNLNLRPDLTLQYWGQPFIATGRYFDHKRITNPLAPNFMDRFSIFTPGQISHDTDNYYIDENLDGTTDYSFEKNDFNFREFLSNLVVRWEYSPGSSVYLVWSQTRDSSTDSGHLNLANDMNELFDASDHKPHNVFLIKFSYRIGLK